MMMKDGPLPPLTDHERSYLRGLWKAHSEKRGKLTPPWIVARQFIDPEDEKVIAAVFAVQPVAEEPWLIRGVLRTSEGAPTLARVSVEHFADPAVEVTSAVLHRIPAATIRDGARAWLRPQAMHADVFEKTGWNVTAAQKRWARRVSAEARKKPLTRGRKGYPREHYQRIALRAVELFADGHRDVLAQLAAEERKPYSTVRDWIYRARSPALRFLEPTKQGRADFRPGPNLYRRDADHA
jgi:hypothetical protein